MFKYQYWKTKLVSKANFPLQGYKVILNNKLCPSLK